MSMPVESVYLLGGGGHGRVVADALLAAGWLAERIRLHDDAGTAAGLPTLPACAPLRLPVQPQGWVHAAVGGARLRESLLLDGGWPMDRWLSVVHPRASLAGSATIGPGCLVAAMAVLGPCAAVGPGTIVNHGAVVDHDVVVGAFSHIAPLASLGGGARVGNRVLIGAGARILPGVSVGDGATVGAGAVVTESIAPGITVGGVPARPLSKSA